MSMQSSVFAPGATPQGLEPYVPVEKTSEQRLLTPRDLGAGHPDRLAVRCFVFHLEVRDRNPATDNSQTVLLSDLLLPLALARTRRGIQFGKRPVDRSLKFEVEDHALNAAAVGSNVLGLVMIEAGKGGIMPGFPRFDEAMVEHLTSVQARGPVAFGEPMTAASQRQINGALRVGGAASD